MIGIKGNILYGCTKQTNNFDKQSRIFDVANDQEKKRIMQDCWGI